MSALAVLESVRLDVRAAVRALATAPRFTVLAVVTLALTIGASTTVFSVFNAVVLQPLPYLDSGHLVSLSTLRSEGAAKQRSSYPDLLDWQTASRTLDLVGHGGLETVLTGAGDPERLQAELFLGDLLSLLGVAPALGAVNSSVDQPVAILSHALWRRRFASNPNVVGTVITLDHVDYIVAAVMPASFEFPIRISKPVDLWIPLKRFNPSLAQRREARLIDVVGRLRAGATLDQAQAEMDVIAASLSERYPATNRGVRVRVTRALDEVVGNASRNLLILCAAVGTLLLIGCANVANLLLARTAHREKGLAIRTALGAGRKRIAHQLLLESLLLAVLAGALGTLLSLWGARAMGSLFAQTLPRANEIVLSRFALGFAAIVSVGAGSLFSMVPIFRARHIDLTRSLKLNGSALGARPSTTKLFSLLVVGQVSLATVLLTTTGLFVHSLWKLDAPEAGLNPRNVLTFEVSWPSSKYRDPGEAFDRMRARLLDLPGVIAASTGLQLPDRGRALLDDTAPFAQVEGMPIELGERASVAKLAIQPGYFRALGITLLAGRDFTADDRARTGRVAIVNDAFVRSYLRGADPLGRQLTLDSWVLAGEQSAEIVGVAADVKHHGLENAQPIVYLPFDQAPVWTSPMVVKTAGDPLELVPVIREAFRSFDPEQPIDGVQRLEQRIANDLVEDRWRAWLLGMFSTLGILLVAVGLYGTLSYITTQRTREIGVRVAFGARMTDILGEVVARGMAPVVGGVVIGLAGTMVASRLIAGFLFALTPTDPATLAVVVAILLTVALLACGAPALRAAKMDPTTVLKQE
jgi:putative ABC transport system permease protein